MDKTLLTASTGLSAQQRFIEVISNNLANVNTTAFKKVRPEFQDLLYETLRTAGNTQRRGIETPADVQIGGGTELVATMKQFGQGDVKQTGNALDMAVNGEGFFVIRRPDNSLAYSRDGSFTADKNGTIVTSQGYPIDPPLVVPENTIEVKISRDGQVSAVLEQGKEGQVIGQIELARFINPSGLRSIGDNLYLETPASGVAQFEQPGSNNTGELLQGHLENSNVDLVEEMVNMIIAQRAYELNSKSVKTAEDVLTTATNLKR